MKKKNVSVVVLESLLYHLNEIIYLLVIYINNKQTRKMMSMTTITSMPKQYLVGISIAIAIILYVLYKKHQTEKLGNTIGDRRTTHSGFNWWN